MQDILKYLPLTEAEREEKIRVYEEEERARRDRETEAERYRLLQERGIPIGPPFEKASPEPWQGGLLYGRTGVGKTHRALCRALSVPASAFTTAYEYIDLARALELDRMDDTQERRWKCIRRSTHLVLDDVGAPRDTAFALEALDRLIDERWRRQAPVLATSNLGPVQLDRRFPRFVSRLLAFGPAEKFGGRDRRLG